MSSRNFSQRSRRSSDRNGLTPRRLIVALAARNKQSRFEALAHCE